MSLEDPFFVVKDEVCKALSKTRSLFQRWIELESGGASSATAQTPTGGSQTPNSGILFVGTPVSAKEELEWTSTELRNSLRSIEWDLEDLEETIGIVEKNPRKFKIATAELSSRQSFIRTTREEVQCMKKRLSASVVESNSKSEISGVGCEVEIATAMSGKMMAPGGGGSTRYSRLVNQGDDSPTHGGAGGYQTTLMHQQAVMSQQDEQLDDLASSMSTLKQMSRQIGHEVDEQAVMLDDFGHEMEHTQSKMDNTLNKIARVMHLTSDRRQWAAIGILTAILIVIVLLFLLL